MLNIFRLIKHDKLDRFGVAVSLTCALHCAFTPILVGLLPLVGLSSLGDEQTEWAFIIVAIGLGAASLLPSYVRQHKQARPLLLFAMGASVLLAARMILEESTRLEMPAVLIGALLIACAHLLNRKLCRACSICQAKSNQRKFTPTIFGRKGDGDNLA